MFNRGYKITFPSAHPNGAVYNVQLCGTAGYLIFKAGGAYAATSTVLYVIVQNNAYNNTAAGFAYMVL